MAGLDAGHAYNTFPLMNGKLVPDEYWSTPGWRNAFESTAAVQLHHRALALTTATAVCATWLLLPRRSLHPDVRMLLNGMLAATGAQVALGITTLLTCVQPAVASTHQAGALVLFTVLLRLLHSVRAPPSPLMAAYGTPAALAVVLAVGTMAVTSA